MKLTVRDGNTMFRSSAEEVFILHRTQEALLEEGTRLLIMTSQEPDIKHMQIYSIVHHSFCTA